MEFYDKPNVFLLAVSVKFSRCVFFGIREYNYVFWCDAAHVCASSKMIDGYVYRLFIVGVFIVKERIPPVN